jgi:hypothetical protein
MRFDRDRNHWTGCGRESLILNADGIMPVIRWSSFSFLVVFAMACSDGIAAPPIGYTHAAATFACGPADGPAVAIYLSPNPVTSLEPSGPYVRIYIDQAVEQVGGKAFPIGGSSPAAAWFQTSLNNYEIASSGYIITSSVSADKTIEGTVNLTLPNAGHISGGFHADWISRAGPFCG